MEKKKVIELKDVTKYYETGDSLVNALDNFKISIEQGDFVAIMGPSGSGKSTSMNLIGNLDYPSKGEVLLDGENTQNLGESELAGIRGKKIGFVFQQFNLIPNLTVRENVMLPMLFQGEDSEKQEIRADELLDKVGLSNRADHYPNQVSGGEQQRVAIARALANDPEIILADEPTGNLDTKTGRNIINILNDLNQKGKTIIMITHEPTIARENARIIYLIRDGKVESIEKKIKGKWRKFL